MLIRGLTFFSVALKNVSRGDTFSSALGRPRRSGSLAIRSLRRHLNARGQVSVTEATRSPVPPP
jgi:hypothetical protein